MKVAIIDTGHFEVVATLAKLFLVSRKEVIVFTNADTRKQVQYLLGNRDSVQWHLKHEQQSNLSFINSIFSSIQALQPDLLFLSTAADNHLLFAYHLRKLRSVPVILTLHDLNSYIQPLKFGGLRLMARSLGKKLLARRANAWHVLAGTLSGFLAENNGTRKKILVIPGSVYEPGAGDPTGDRVTPGGTAALITGSETTAQPLPQLRGATPEPEVQGKFNVPLRIVVPGSVDDRRRDYTQVFSLLEAANDAGLPLLITLLGAFNDNYGSETRQRVREYTARYNNLEYYQSPVVDQPEFDRVMAASHFIWSPQRPSLQVEKGITEYYGKTICSGNIGDAIRFARPLIVPRFLLLDTPLRENCISYADTTELIRFLAGLTARDYAGRLFQATTASKAFTLETVVAQYPELFDSLII